MNLYRLIPAPLRRRIADQIRMRLIGAESAQHHPEIMAEFSAEEIAHANRSIAADRALLAKLS